MTGQSVVDWDPLLLLSDGGLWLGASDRSWVVGQRREAGRPVNEDARSLMPLLERSWSIAKEELEEVEQRFEHLGRIPTEPTVRLALSWPAYWAELALNWLADGYPKDGLADEIAAVESKPGFPQSVRHLARRVRRS